MSKVETSNLELEAGFSVPAALLFQAFTDEKMITGYTQSKATVEAKEGGKFTMFGGSLEGSFTSLKVGEEIVEQWRFKEWAEDYFSTVTIKFEAVGSAATKIKLSHTNIPHVDRYGNHGIPQKVEAGWKQFFFDRIHKILGFPKLE